jgi:transposase
MIPEWVKKHKPPKSEIRDFDGRYYVYSISSIYDPKRHRAKKITGPLLGRITEKGFIESEKFRLKHQTYVNISVKEFGAYTACKLLMEKEIEKLREIFPEQYQEIIALFYLRLSYNSTIKNTPLHYEHSCASQELKAKITEKRVAALLEDIGKKRESIIKFKQAFQMGNDFIAIDSTNIFSESKALGNNHADYNSTYDYRPQINLLCIFSNSLPEPIYYRLTDGNNMEIKSFKLSLLESGITDAVIIADKDFYSKSNIVLLDEEGLRYIIPLERNDQVIEASELKKPRKETFKDYFLYHERIIWYYEYKKDGKTVSVFLDSKLKVEEESDYLRRIQSHPEEYSMQGFEEKEHLFGSISFIHNLDSVKPEEIYLYYKTRGNIELFFDSFKNVLKADRTYMQNKDSLEGWMFINFLAMKMYSRLVQKLKSKKLLSKYTPKDILLRLINISKIQINGQWHLSEINAETSTLLNSLGINIK